MFNIHRFLRPGYQPVYLIAAASVIGTLFFSTVQSQWLPELLSGRWTLQYFLLTPFMHGGFAHLLFNLMALHFIGGMMLLPAVGWRNFLLVFVIAIMVGNLANNFFAANPAIGISGGIMGMLSCVLYPLGRVPMKFLFIHDILRLPPFPLYGVAIFVVMLDIAGLLFSWQHFAHWGHLGGFAAGAVVGWFIFCYPRRRQKRQPRMTIH